MLLRSALMCGAKAQHWAVRAQQAGVPVVEIVESYMLQDTGTPATGALELVPGLGTDALRLLELALKRDDLASLAVDALGRIGEPAAMDLLRQSLRRQALAPYARAALERLVRSDDQPQARGATHALLQQVGPGSRTTSPESAALLVRLAVLIDPLRAPAASQELIRALRTALRQSPLAASAVEALGNLDAVESVDLLKGASIERPLVPRILASLERLSVSLDAPVAEYARAVLLELIHSELQRRDAVLPAIDVLGRLEIPKSVELLNEALNRPELAEAALSALEALARSRSSEVAGLAQARLSAQPVRRSRSRSPRHEYSARVSSHSYDQVAELLVRGNVLPVLGSATSFGSRPVGLAWDRQSASYLPTSTELARYLAMEVKYPAEPDQDLDFGLVASYFQRVAGRRYLIDRLIDVYSRPVEQSSIHRFLANGPFRIFLTTTYDDLLERAFEQAGRRFDVITIGTARGQELVWWPAGAEPVLVSKPNELYLNLDSRSVIVKLRGSMSRRHTNRSSAEADAIVTEEDHLELIARLTSGLLPVPIARELRHSYCLFLGLGLGDWFTRSVVRFLRQGGSFTSEESSFDDLVSWAVLVKPSIVERELFDSLRVKVIDSLLDDFVDGVQARRG